MKKTKYTQGPWNLREGGQPVDFLVYASKQDICTLLTHDKTGEANGRLIAAAPDLLEACKRLIEGHKSLHPRPLEFAKCDYCDIGQRSISKAEGKLKWTK